MLSLPMLPTGGKWHTTLLVENRQKSPHRKKRLMKRENGLNFFENLTTCITAEIILIKKSFTIFLIIIK